RRREPHRRARATAGARGRRDPHLAMILVIALVDGLHRERDAGAIGRHRRRRDVRELVPVRGSKGALRRLLRRGETRGEQEGRKGAQRRRPSHGFEAPWWVNRSAALHGTRRRRGRPKKI